MNQNINNQQVSNEVSDGWSLKWNIIKESARELFFKHNKKYPDPENSVEDRILKSFERDLDAIYSFIYDKIKAHINKQSNPINEPITDKEIDAEIERYIKQFWPRPEHGGAVRLGFKRAVRWMQERGAKSDFLHVLEENYEATKKMSEVQVALTTKYALLETYEDLIAIYKSNYTEATKPINNEPLSEKFKSVIIEEYGNLVLNSLVKKCVQVAEQFVASKLNNTIEDKFQLLCVGRRVKVDTEYYTVTSAMELSDSILFNLQKSNGSLRVEIKKSNM